MKRANGDDQKEQRRQAILNQAAVLLTTQDFDSVTLVDVATRLNLVKGTLYRYFPTKEALVLEVLERELDSWLSDFLRGQAEFRARSAQELASILAASLAERSLLVKLFSIVHVVLERHLPVERLVAFKQHLATVLVRAAEMVERAWPPLTGQGVKALLGFYALAIGVGHLAERTVQSEQVLSVPGLEVFRIDFERQLAQGLGWLLSGLVAEAALDPPQGGAR